MRMFLRHFLAFIILSNSNTLVFGQGIAVAPSRVLFTGAAGQTVSQTITFTNTSTEEFNFVASMKDWDRDSLGVKVYYVPGSRPESNVSWLQLSENSAQLSPGETKSINLTMNIPSDPLLAGQTNSMVFFTQVKKQQENKKPGVNVNVLLEVGVQVYHTPLGLFRGDLEFLAFEDRGNIDTKGGSRRQIDVKIKNTGAINKDAYVRFELTNMETGEEIPVEAIAIAMLPEAEQWVRFLLPEKLMKGKYLSVAILDAGSQYDLKIAEKEITY